ncbi:RagB/SusD family nutrient uptake outer membrane protein [Parapedobacter sp. 2B3]|uniref:RagB/SusD family nutrient uptake outer membrane protein n=1 Tax=Parapedobacter sp. 2B3 TaxID=3342381 RepID=UPI0035B5D289
MKYTMYLLAILVSISCSKSWLEKKNDSGMVVPSTLKDLQSILDRNLVMNNYYPVIGDLASDDYYLSYNIWQALSLTFREIYTWESNFLDVGSTSIWQRPYLTVFYANAALEGVEKIAPNMTNKIERSNIVGSAHFFRAFAFYTTSQIFAKHYSSATANSDLGIVLRTTTDVNVKSKRSTVQESYDKIISDLKIAVSNLPINPVYKFRPSKPAAYALLARTYLVMSDYENALLYADSCLQFYSKLMDYNSLDSTQPFPIPFLNEEVIFQAAQAGDILANNNNYLVDTTLYELYGQNDLRKDFFFRTAELGNHFKGTYMGASPGINVFGGIATDEVYLIRAECFARLGNSAAAMADLNELLENRWVSGTFVPLTATTPGDALERILIERRKELLFRGLRWSDLRRLNKDPKFEKTLVRLLDQDTFTILPNSSKYVFPIPQAVIDATGMEQNQR